MRPKKKESKKLRNYFLDIILTLFIFTVLLSSYIIWFILPRGVGMHGGAPCNGMWGYGLWGNSYEVFNWPRYTWIEIHNWASIILLLIIIFHIILHLKLILEIVKRVSIHFLSQNKLLTQKFIVALALFTLFILDCFSGFVIWLILPRGSLDYFHMINGIGRTFWGLQRNTWIDIHAWLAITIISIVIIHLILNWKWVIAISKKIVKLQIF